MHLDPCIVIQVSPARDLPTEGLVELKAFDDGPPRHVEFTLIGPRGPAVPEFAHVHHLTDLQFPRIRGPRVRATRRPGRSFPKEGDDDDEDGDDENDNDEPAALWQELVIYARSRVKN